jgi:hypothetical protein
VFCELSRHEWLKSCYSKKSRTPTTMTSTMTSLRVVHRTSTVWVLPRNMGNQNFVMCPARITLTNLYTISAVHTAANDTIGCAKNICLCATLYKWGVKMCFIILL